MIAKAIKGTGFRGALEYDLKKEQGHIIDTNMTGTRPRELAAEFGEIRKLRPGLNKAVLHVSLSATPGEHLTDAQWIAIGQRYLKGMGFESNQYLITRHTDTAHEHVHMLINRIRFDGEVTSDSHDYRRQEIVMRAIERELGLRQVESSKNAERRAATKGEIEQGLRTGKPSTRQQLQQLCDAAARDCGSFTDYAARLQMAGVDLVPVTQLEGTKLSGLSYRLDGVMMKGSDLGKRYSPLGLSKIGVGYDKERDHEAVGRCLQRSALEGIRGGDRRPALGQGGERAGIGGDARTAGAGNGSTDGRNAGDAGDHRTAQPRAGRGDESADRDGGEGAGPSIEQRQSSRADDAGRQRADTNAPLRAGGIDSVDDSDARERILALACAADGAESPGRKSGSRIPAARDRTREAVERQIAAIGAARYEIVVSDTNAGRQTLRQWSAADLVNSVQWLKRMNARGADILVRSLDGPEMRVIAALDAEGVDRLRSLSLAPALTVETSPGRFEAWVKLSDWPLPVTTRAAFQSRIAQSVADAKQYGHLAGFTGQGMERKNAGRKPFALVREASGKVAPMAGQYFAEIERKSREKAAEQQRLAEAARAQTCGRGRSR